MPKSKTLGEVAHFTEDNYRDLWEAVEELAAIVERTVPFSAYEQSEMSNVKRILHRCFLPSTPCPF